MNEDVSLARLRSAAAIEGEIPDYAFQLYVQNGHRNDRCDDNWREAEQYIHTRLGQAGARLSQALATLTASFTTIMTTSTSTHPSVQIRIGIAADHGGYALKSHLLGILQGAGYAVTDYGARRLDADDDYPDFIQPMAEAVAAGTLDRGIGICGSGVGACIVANKVKGVHACLIHDVFCAHQGVEDDHLNVMCLGGRVIGDGLAWELVQIFLAARFSNAERHLRRVTKLAALEDSQQPRLLSREAVPSSPGPKSLTSSG